MDNLILTKPKSDDTYDIVVFNNNSGLIEDAINGINTAITDSSTGNLIDFSKKFATLETYINTLSDETLHVHRYPKENPSFDIDSADDGISIVSNMEVDGTFPDDITETKKNIHAFQ